MKINPSVPMARPPRPAVVVLQYAGLWVDDVVVGGSRPLSPPGV